MQRSVVMPRGVKSRNFDVKDELRRRYKERLSSARQTLLDQRRRGSSTGQNAPAPAQTDNIKHEILTKMQIDASVDLHETLDPDYLVLIMNEISEELRQEENLLLAEQEAYLNNQEIRQTMIAEATVCCPICRSHPLRQNKQVIFCACGMRIDCQVDHTTLQGFGESLNDCVNLHKEGCDQEPVFSVEPMFGSQYLLLRCSDCKTKQIVV